MKGPDHSRIKIRSALLTDVGVVRDHNEDSALVDEGADFFVVADGMGGHAAGEVASAMAVETVRESLEEARGLVQAFAENPSDAARKEIVALLEAAVRKAHSAVYTRGIKEPDKQGMGTTLDVVLLAGPEAFVAHVGDSRTYLIRDGRAAQITTDHTVAEVLVIEGKLSLEEAQLSPLRTILVNAIGVAPDVGVEMAHVRLRKDDVLLLCSDGLHDYFPAEQELADYTTENEPEDALDKMIELAKNRGGHDNITGIMVEVLDAPPEENIASPFDIEPTEPASTEAVPEPISTGDTMPHQLIDEADLDESTASDNGVPAADSDIKTTVPMRPITLPGELLEKERSKRAPERSALSRAGTEPPEPMAEADTEPESEVEAKPETAEKPEEPEPETSKEPADAKPRAAAGDGTAKNKKKKRRRKRKARKARKKNRAKS